MAIKVETQEIGNAVVTYPKLMKTHSGQVVLFHRNKTGMVVKSTGNNAIGHFSENWDMNSFTDYTGSITLTND